MDIDIGTMRVGTLHSLFLNILEENIQYSDLKKNYRLVDEFEQKYIVYKNIEKFRKVPDFEIFIGDMQGKWNQTNKILGYLNKLNEERVAKETLLKNDNIKIRILGDFLEVYEEILKEVLKYGEDKLILLALGPTATVLAYDLYKAGYWAVDIGHVDIEYEWFLRKATEKIKIETKYVNEAKDGEKDIQNIHDEKYESEIVSKLLKK